MKTQKIFPLSPSAKKEIEVYEGNLLRGKFLGFELVLFGESVDKFLLSCSSWVKCLIYLLLFLFLLLNGFQIEANKVLQVLLSFL